MHPLLQTRGVKPRKGDVKTCSVCGTEFYRQPAYVAQGRHLCSTECNRTWQTKPATLKTCTHCGAEMTLKPSQTARQFCSKRCESDHKIARPAGRAHNGRPVRVNNHGYVLVWEPNHPNKSMGGWQLEHRLVAEQALGHYLTTAEQVDHINQDKTDNRPENLQVLDASSHSIKTNAENLGALKILRSKLAAYEAKYGPLPME